MKQLKTFTNKLADIFSEDWDVISCMAGIALLIATLLGLAFWYDSRYQCVRGHNEEVWQVTYTYNQDGSMYPSGGYWADEFVCDCRLGIDTLK